MMPSACVGTGKGTLDIVGLPGSSQAANQGARLRMGWNAIVCVQGSRLVQALLRDQATMHFVAMLAAAGFVMHQAGARAYSLCAPILLYVRQELVHPRICPALSAQPDAHTTQRSAIAGAQSAPDQEIDFISEPKQRAEFDDSAFTSQFVVTADTPAFKVSAHTLDQDPFLGTLPNEGQSQVLFELPVRAPDPRRHCCSDICAVAGCL